MDQASFVVIALPVKVHILSQTKKYQANDHKYHFAIASKYQT